MRPAKPFSYWLLDVFTEKPFGGNPLAVFPDAGEIPPSRLQAIARELNLSETVYVYPPADPAHHAKLRIFTPAAELPMAGHPTVGTAHLLAHLNPTWLIGTRSVLHLEELVGTIAVEINRTGSGPGRVTMDQPLPSFGGIVEDREGIAAMLGLRGADLLPNAPVQVVSCGVPYTLVPLRDRAAVQSARLFHQHWQGLLAASEAPAVFIFALDPQTATGSAHCRMFAPHLGVAEDPATGSACGPLGCYLVAQRLLGTGKSGRYVLEQGFAMHRPSIIHVSILQNSQGISRVRVGGHSVIMGQGTLKV